MTRNVIVAGVGMIPFAKPGASETYDVMASRAACEALSDARVAYDDARSAGGDDGLFTRSPARLVDTK